ncbi:hypothetical protein H6P81_001947 [Aristolochia fimbriata]|uniref:Serine aminopeptidase S33 domain-containing protein n=1 Tax=Aristolochia fimbriata TaxID=158543 RepID=A0AAV7F8Z3_ARIFI|nr:hypothetical protein H6P81_001947 [Aristolochia fimbriata]
MEQLVNFIIRPPRADYSPKNDLLDEEFMLKGQWYRRKDLEVINSRGNVLQCSHYLPLNIPDGMALPCVIYCHGNSGCRADASEAAIILLPSWITVFTLDFSGSGLSEGEHVTLGWNEKDDLKAVVNHLRTDKSVSCIGLWGRSMGAVTSLMYGAEDPSIAGMVLDSPFSNLVDLMMELVDTYKVRLPKFTVKFAIQYMRKVIQKKAKFDIMDLNAIQVASSCFVPVLFGHATDDDFIQPHHSDRIFDAYVGDKNIIKFDGDHNSPRPQFYFDSITIFFLNVLNPPKDVFQGTYLRNGDRYVEKKENNEMHKVQFIGSLGPSTNEATSGSTEEALSHLRLIRPMSRTEVPNDVSSQESHSEQEGKGIEDDLGSSSSRLITFDLTGDPHSYSHTTEDGYLEYSFDDLGDFPCNLEDEERMFMEAVIESLKDLETRHPHEEDQPTPENIINPVQSEKYYASVADSNGCKETASACSTSTSSSEVAAIEEASLPAPAAPQSADTRSPCTKVSSTGDDSSGSSSSINDGTGGTRATLRVEKNPASHVLEGLVHRWGLNFFKSNG